MDSLASQVTARYNIVDGLIPEIVENINQALSERNHYICIQSGCYRHTN